MSRRLSIKVPFEMRETGAKILFLVLKGLEKRERWREHAELLEIMSEEMEAFMRIDLDKAVKIASKYAVLHFKGYQQPKSYKEMRSNVINATEELMREHKGW